MTRWLKLLVVPFLVLFLLVGGAFGSNITIFDKNGSITDGIGQGGEDQETEPGMVNRQAWDMEGFFINGTTLYMLSGYNLASGYGGYAPGDIFIDVDGDAEFGDIHGSINGNEVPTTNTFGYDYVLDIGIDKFTIVELIEGATVQRAYYKQNQGSNPWKYVEGGELKYTSNKEEFSVKGDLTNDDVFGLVGYELFGGTHYAMSLNVDPLFNLIGSDNLTFHYTMECGNDNLMGQTAPVPEPATMLLLGTGLIGLAGASRKKFKK